MRPEPLARDLAAILIGAALLLLPGLASVDLFNPDEPREAEIAREMRESGDLLVPTFNGCPFLEKPPLFYWSSRLFSIAPGLPPEASARMPSVLAAIGLLFVTYFIGRTLRGRRAGRAAAFLLLTTFQFWWLARRALLDMTLAFFVGAALLFFLLGVRRARGHRWFMLAGVAGAGAVLTKGLIGLVIPGLAIIAYLVWRREVRTILSPALLGAAAIPLAAVGLWLALLAGRADGTCYLREFLIENHWKRFLGGGSGGHAQPIWYYLESLITDFLPWILFLPAALVSLWPGLRRKAPPSPPPSPVGSGETASREVSLPAALARRAGPDAFLHAWLIPGLIVLSIASSKRSIYLLPLAPAAALLVAAWWRKGRPGWKKPTWGPALAIPSAILLALGVLVAALLPIAIGILMTGREAGSVADVREILSTAPWGVPSGAAFLIAVLMVPLIAKRERRRGAAAAVLLVWVIFLVSGVALLPLAEPRLSARRFGEAIRLERERGSRIAASRITEGSLGQFLFYSKGTVDWIGRRSAEPESACCDCRLPITAEEFLRGDGPRVCLLLEDEFERLPIGLRRGRVLERGKVGGASYVLLSAWALRAGAAAPRGP